MRQEDTDNSVLYYRRRLQEKEEELAGLRLEVVLSEGLAQITTLPAWKVLLDRLQGLERDLVKRLRTTELSPYLLGRVQGSLFALNAMIDISPKKPEELAEHEKRSSILIAEIAELRKLAS